MTMTVVSAPRQAAVSPRIAPTAMLVGAIGFLAAFVGSWVPSFWSDEAATISSATRPLSSLPSLLTHVDAVHGAYYVLMHFWVKIFGISEVSMRLPSAIAVGLMVGGVVVLAIGLTTRWGGILSGLVAIVLPRTIDMGGEARSYALSAATAVWLTILLLWLVRQNRARPWLWFALAFSASIYLFLYLALLAPVYAVFLIASRHHLGVTRTDIRRWALATGAAVLLSSPVILASILERGQIASVGKAATTESVYLWQWFYSPPLAALCWSLIGLAALIGVYMQSRTKWFPPIIALGLTWLLIPTTILAVLSFISPSYTPRYASFCIPAIALLIGVALSALPRNSWGIIGLVLITALAIPTDIGLREPTAKGSDWAQASSTLAAAASPGQAVVFQSDHARGAFISYPEAFKSLADVGRIRPPKSTNGLWGTRKQLRDIPNENIPVVWLWTDHDSAAAVAVKFFTDAGYRVESKITLPDSTLYEMHI